MLSKNDLAQIEIAYESARDVDASESARKDEHAILMGILQRLGLRAGNVIEAYDTCERVLFGGAG